MKNNIIVLLGKSNAGKTTLAKQIEEELGYEKIVTCTTRPKRKGEKEGIDYHFLTVEESKRLIEKGEMLEYEIFNDWIYSTRFCDIDLNKKQVIVLNPSGYKTLKNKFPDNVLGIYIKPNFFTRIHRIINRDRGGYKESVRRFLADEKDFKNIDKLSKTHILKANNNASYNLHRAWEIINYEK